MVRGKVTSYVATTGGRSIFRRNMHIVLAEVHAWIELVMLDILNCRYQACLRFGRRESPRDILKKMLR